MPTNRETTERLRTDEELDAEADVCAVGDVIDWQLARALRSYTEVEAIFTSVPDRTFRLMARDLPRGNGDSVERRFTNLDTGSEVFLASDGRVPAGCFSAGEPLFQRIVVTKRA